MNGFNQYIYMTYNPHESRRLGQWIGEQLCPGDVVPLFGEMGAGKTVLTKGIAVGLDIKETVLSPSFTVMQYYPDGRVPLYHYDWFRISGKGDLQSNGLDEYLYLKGVSVIEWPEKALDLLPSRRLDVYVTMLHDENTRQWMLYPRGGFVLKGKAPKIECLIG